MKIVFGWNHFRVKSYNPNDLGIINHSSDFTIEARQRYFHLFWIPFFSIGKKWMIKKDGEFYELPMEYEELINANGIKFKTSWFAFTGIITLLLTWVGYILYDKYHDFKYRQYLVQEWNADRDATQKKLHQPGNYDYYLFKTTEEKSNEAMYGKVLEVNAKAIKVQLSKKQIIIYPPNPMGARKSFLENISTDTVWVERSGLEKAFKQDYEATQINGVKLLSGESSFFVEEAYRIDGPLIEDRGTGGISYGHINIGFRNSGYDATITAIKVLAGKVKWDSDQLPRLVKSDIDFSLRGTIKAGEEPYYKFEITCMDSSYKEYKYLVTGTNYTKTVERL
jgi:hypothetical protein